MNSFKYVQIRLNSESDTFKAGDLVTGQVSAELNQPMKVRGLRIVVLGESLTHWTKDVKGEDGEDHATPFIGHEEYINLNFYAIGSETSRAIELPVGQLFSYPFSIQLPYDLPSNLEHDCAYVRYSIKAIFERTSKSDCTIQRDFSVNSNYDLNDKPQARVAIKEVIDKSFCCLCICPWGKLCATISIPSTGFVPGQSIPVTVHCENASTVDVSKIKVFLVKTMKLYVHLPERSASKYMFTVADVKCEYPFNTTFEDHVTVQLRVPQGLQPSGLEYCGIIDLGYSLKVEVCFSGMHCSVDRKFPILIGTVPLLTSSNDYDLDPTMAPSPSAPLLQQPSPSAPPSYGSVHKV